MRPLVRFATLCAFAVAACSKPDPTLRAKREGYIREHLAKTGAVETWELSQNPDVRMGLEWGGPEVAVDMQPLRAHRWMGRWGSIRLRVPNDEPRTFRIVGVSIRNTPMRARPFVTLRSGNNLIDSFPGYADGEAFEYSRTFTSEEIRRYREGDWLYLTLEVPTSESPGERGYKAYGLALRSVQWQPK